MSVEQHRQDHEAPRAQGDPAPAREAAAETGNDDAVRRTEEEGSDARTRGTGVSDDDSDSPESGSADVEAADGEAETSEAPPGSESSEATAATLEEELAEARRTATENLDRALRAQAELENVRRRFERDLQNAHKFALERFVSELLPVKDSLELGLAASAEKGASAANITEGVELTLRMLEQAMEKFGISAVDPTGEPFDPEFHQAMSMQESDTAKTGTVLTVVQKGYLLNERLVRPAMVIVAK